MPPSHPSGKYPSTNSYYSNSCANPSLYSSLLNQKDLDDYSLMLPLRLAQYLEQIKEFFVFGSASLNWILYGAGQEAEISTQNFTNIPVSYHSCVLAWQVPMDRGAWRVTVDGVTKSPTIEWLTTHGITKKKSLTFSFKATLRFPEHQYFH